MMLVDSHNPSLTVNTTSTNAANNNCHTWAESLSRLLNDGDGVRLFRLFLDQEGCSSSLDFWFACQGYRNTTTTADSGSEGVDSRAHKLAKVIYQTYIRGDHNRRSMGIKSETRRALSDHLRSSSGANCQRTASGVTMEPTLFDAAQSEVEAWMRTSLHPAFIKSDLYIQAVQSWETDNQRLSGSSSPSSPMLDDRDNTVEEQLLPGASIGGNLVTAASLPTLDEDRELHLDYEVSSFDFDCSSPQPLMTSSSTCSSSVVAAAATLTTANLLVTRFHRAGQSYRRRQSLENVVCGYQNAPGNPYHISYAPTSEVHSISSGQHSEDTGSRTTESSSRISGGNDMIPPIRSSNRWSRGQSRSSSRRCQQTQILATEQGPILPRTAGLSSNQRRTLAEADPSAFVHALSTRLEALSEERAKMERIQRLMEETGLSASDQESRCHSEGPALLRQPWADHLRAKPDPHAADAQAILEEHCSRIWAKSVEGSPPSDAAETGSPPGTTHLHHHLHHHHTHHRSSSSSSRRQRHHHQQPSADTVSVCTLGVDSGVSLPTVLSTGSSAPSYSAHHTHHHGNTMGGGSSGGGGGGGGRSTGGQTVQPASDKVLAWIYESSEAQAQRSRSSVRSSARSPPSTGHQTSTTAPVRPRSSSTDDAITNPEGGIVCGYYLSGDSVPFRCHWPESSITLGQFKQLVARKSNYRFFFKQVCTEFEPGVVYEEVSSDNSQLPLWEGKVVAKLVRVE